MATEHWTTKKILDANHEELKIVSEDINLCRHLIVDVPSNNRHWFRDTIKFSRPSYSALIRYRNMLDYALGSGIKAVFNVSVQNEPSGRQFYNINFEITHGYLYVYHMVFKMTEHNIRSVMEMLKGKKICVDIASYVEGGRRVHELLKFLWKFPQIQMVAMRGDIVLDWTTAKRFYRLTNAWLVRINRTIPLIHGKLEYEHHQKVWTALEGIQHAMYKIDDDLVWYFNYCETGFPDVLDVTRTTVQINGTQFSTLRPLVDKLKSTKLKALVLWDCNINSGEQKGAKPPKKRNKKQI